MKHKTDQKGVFFDKLRLFDKKFKKRIFEEKNSTKSLKK